MSVTLNLHVMRPEDPDCDDDLDAVRQIDAVGNRVFLGPDAGGRLPGGPAFRHGARHRLVVRPGRRHGHGCRSRCPCWASTTTRRPGRAGSAAWVSGSCADGHGDSSASPWVGADDVEFVPVPGPYTAMGWNIDPSGMTELLTDGRRALPRAPADGHRERRRVLRRGLAPTAGCRTRTGSCYLHGHIDAVGLGASRRASTSAATSCGRCWTTSSGPTGTTGGSGSSESTTTRSSARSRTPARWYAELIRTRQLPEVPS